jgi:hypothetical protein
MTKKSIGLIVSVLLLGGFSLYLNRDRFKTEPIHISHRSMPPRGGPLSRGRTAATAVDPIIFLVNKELRLTSVKVVAVGAVAASESPHALWRLVSDSRSAPIQEFTYGVTLPGMKSVVKGAVADPLEPGVQYRIFVEAGSTKLEHDFTPVSRTP